MRELSSIRGFGPARLSALEKRDVRSAEDLLMSLPVGYRDATHPASPAEMKPGCVGCFCGFVTSSALHRVKGRQWVSASIADERGSVRCMWFNQPWIREKLPQNAEVFLYGACVRKKNGSFVINPVFIEPGAIHPVYKPIPGIGQKLLSDAVSQLLREDEVEENLPAFLLETYGLMDRASALMQVHFPTDYDALSKAKRRMAFEELMMFQAAVSTNASRSAAKPIVLSEAAEDAFWAALPYRPTQAQRRVACEIRTDLARHVSMARLVQGDVGSGKTALALYALYSCAAAGGQSALMAPTEILAQQHGQSAKALLTPLGVTCGVLTGNMTAAEHRRAREAIESGQWQVVIGTHALLSENVAYRDLRLVVTDEQHRFGVRQRSALQKKGNEPHVLVMSATPIPRTLSLILYGDLDLSVIDEMPPGHGDIQTRIVPEDKRQGLHAFIRQEAERGFQTYVVCPQVGIEDDEALDQEIASAEATYRTLGRALSPLRVGLLHGKMKKAQKEETIEWFRTGQLDVLVATTVIEVGVNVPSATLMVIENAERFGLAQLHQLRGRVGRGTEKSWCFLMAEPSERLRVLTQTRDGFAIAQKDLELRGAGELFGTRQHGTPHMPALLLTGGGELLTETREAFLSLCRDPAHEEALQTLRTKAEKRYGARAVGLN